MNPSPARMTTETTAPNATCRRWAHRMATQAPMPVSSISASEVLKNR